MKILYLYAELMGYQMPIFNEYVHTYNCSVYVVHDVKGKLTKYKPKPIENVYYYNKDDFSANALKKFVLNLNPDIVYVSGWMYYDYIRVVYKLRKKNIPVVTMFDDIWWKTVKQRIAAMVFPFIKNKIFSHAWVAGPFQYEYAKRLGFTNSEIIFNALSADTKIYNDAYHNSIYQKHIKYPHRFLFAGRLEAVKGIHYLLEAWENIKEQREDWELMIIGNGSINPQIHYSNVLYYDFMQPEELVNRIKETGCYILPSVFEPWGVVLHEFSVAGLPIICSDVCGGLPFFVINNFNGFVFKSSDIGDLSNKMLNIIKLSDKELIKMAENSHSIGQRISPRLSAASFLSILN